MAGANSQLSSVADDGDAEVFQALGSQLRQRLAVDFVLAKRRLVLR
jgi:hypothetical protein